MTSEETHIDLTVREVGSLTPDLGVVELRVAVSGIWHQTTGEINVPVSVPLTRAFQDSVHVIVHRRGIDYAFVVPMSAFAQGRALDLLLLPRDVRVETDEGMATIRMRQSWFLGVEAGGPHILHPAAMLPYPRGYAVDIEVAENIRSAVEDAVADAEKRVARATMNRFRRFGSIMPVAKSELTAIVVKTADLPASARATSVLSTTCRDDPEGQCVVQRIDEVVIEVSSNLDLDEVAPVIGHELLHAFGLTHTCFFPSVLRVEWSATHRELCRADGLTSPLMVGVRGREVMTNYDLAALSTVYLLADVAGRSWGPSAIHSLTWAR